MRITSRAFTIIALLTISFCAKSSTASGELTEDTLDRVKKSVVVIQVGNKFGKPIAFGSGFAVGKGIIATNIHVLEGGHRFLVVRSDKKTVAVTGILAFDPKHDIALVEVSDKDGKGNIPPLDLTQDKDVKTGKPVFVIGHPKGLRFSVSRGIISSTDRTLRDIDKALPSEDVIQTDAATAPGSSGGPWIDENGNVVGVHRAGLSVAGTKTQGFNFATHVKYLRKLLTEKFPKKLPRDYFSGEDTLGRRWITLFPTKNPRIENLTDLEFVGPGRDRNVIGKFKTDGAWGISDDVLQPISGKNTAIGLDVVDDFELSAEIDASGTGGWFMLMGWDGENGLLFYTVSLRTSAVWRTAEIRNGESEPEVAETHLTKFRPNGWQDLSVKVERKRLSMKVGETEVIDKFSIGDYTGGSLILGTYATQYGAKKFRVREMKLRSR